MEIPAGPGTAVETTTAATAARTAGGEWVWRGAEALMHLYTPETAIQVHRTPGPCVTFCFNSQDRQERVRPDRTSLPASGGTDSRTAVTVAGSMISWLRQAKIRLHCRVCIVFCWLHARMLVCSSVEVPQPSTAGWARPLGAYRQ